ncbi:hypothetical protein [Robertmurraya massiliosenegalensis]|nr:hypothetical protein [Robertmurraya massiliosenegalensis]
MNMKATEVLEIIKNMEVSEKWKLLNELYHLHYDKRNSPKAEIKY